MRDGTVIRKGVFWLFGAQGESGVLLRTYLIAMKHNPLLLGLSCFAFLGAIVLAGTVLQAEESEGVAAAELLEDFEGEEAGADWRTVNDNVMGGRSRGGPSYAHGVLTFSGSTNTNGGGFSSLRAEPAEYDLSDMSGLLIRVRGDGRTYKAAVRTDVKVRRWTVPFRADFDTLDGVWMEVYIPFEAFTPSHFGREFDNPPALDLSKISALGLMIYDGEDGPFHLEVDWIKAVSSDPRGADRTEG